MGIMNFVRKFGKDKQIVKEKYKEAEQELRIQQMLEERQKSSNRRELEKYMKDQEEAEIKRRLDVIHKKQNQDLWKPKNHVFDQKMTILKDDRPILKEKNIFVDNKTNNPITKNKMFFK